MTLRCRPRETRGPSNPGGEDFYDAEINTGGSAFTRPRVRGDDSGSRTTSP